MNQEIMATNGKSRQMSGELVADRPPGSSKLRSTRDVNFVVTNVRDARGFGLHISSTDQTDGFGGRFAECHFRAGSVENPRENLLFLCYDGFLDASRAQNEYRIDLGPKSNILQIEITLAPTRVDLSAVLLSKNQANDQRYTYPLDATIPIREETGFWQSGKLYYSSNGVLNNRLGRDGEDYFVLAPAARPAIFQKHDTFFSENNMEEPVDNASPVEL